MSNRTVTQLGAIVLMVPLMVPLSAQNQMVKGNTYADTVEVGVRTLTLIGGGLRERGWLDIYTMGAYAENRTCDPQMLISMGGAKSLRIDLLRDVDAKSMAAEIEKALEKNLPPDAPPDLRSQIDTFRGYFKKDLEKGDSMEMTYVPGVGTALMQNREQQGVTVQDKGFADILWASFFSSETCCSGLKKQILEHCSR